MKGYDSLSAHYCAVLLSLGNIRENRKSDTVT